MLSLRIVPWVALGTFGLIGVLFGRLTCGWACPFGFLQDLIARIPIRKWNPPRWTRWIKYAVLIGMVFIVAIMFGVNTRWFFCGICPDATLTATIPAWLNGVVKFSVIQVRLAFLVGFLALMIFVTRGFCRLVCPIGAGLGLFNRVSLLSIKFNRDTCLDCMRCVRDCPSGLGPMKDSRDPECVYCLDCFKCDSLSLDFSDNGKR